MTIALWPFSCLIIQYVPRLFLIFPLNQKIVKTTGVVAKTAWAGAAYNLLLFMLASHVSKHAFSISYCFVLLKMHHEFNNMELFHLCVCLFRFVELSFIYLPLGGNSLVGERSAIQRMKKMLCLASIVSWIARV